jgi:hypothetical protein
MSITTWPLIFWIVTSAVLAEAYLATLVSASMTTKYAAASTAAGSRSSSRVEIVTGSGARAANPASA